MVLDHCIFVGAKTLNFKVIPIIYLNFSSSASDGWALSQCPPSLVRQLTIVTKT